MAAAEAALPPESVPPAVASLPRIVIDPGHGGVDSGAMVGGLIEKAIVLDFAKALAAKLVATGHYTVVMTREDDTFIFARRPGENGARRQLRRSSSPSMPIQLSEADVTGATVYTVSDKASDTQAARVAEKENQSDAAAGVEGKEEANGVSGHIVRSDTA